MALHPPLIRYVKGYPYRVQPGDHVTQICGRFGMPASKWPELVGANLHKPTCGCGGTLYKCFSRLEPGELLRIPAHWREPGGQTRLGLGIPLPTLPNIDLMNAFVTMVQAYVTTHPTTWPLPSPPTPATVTPIAQVLYTWFPYLRNLPAVTNKSAFPTDPIKLMEAIVTKGILTEQSFALLIVSANTFLKAIGINEGEPVPSWVKAIPWGDIPWNTIGQTLLKINAAAWSQLNTIFAKKDPANVPPQIEEPYTTPPTLPLPNFFDPSTWNANEPAGKVIQSAQFASTRWDSPFTQAVVSHKDFISCSIKRASSNVYTKLVKCEECYTTPDDFVALLCSDKADPCLDCKPSTPPLPPVEPGREDPSKPPVEPVVAGEKSDNTFTYAAAAVGVVLVGGLIVMMSGDK